MKPGDSLNVPATVTKIEDRGDGVNNVTIRFPNDHSITLPEPQITGNLKAAPEDKRMRGPREKKDA